MAVCAGQFAPESLMRPGHQWPAKPNRIYHLAAITVMFTDVRLTCFSWGSWFRFPGFPSLVFLAWTF